MRKLPGSCQHLRTLVEQYRLCSECSKDLRCKGSQPCLVNPLPSLQCKGVYFKVCFYSLIVLYNVLCPYPPRLLLTPPRSPPHFFVSEGSLQWTVIYLGGAKHSMKADSGGKKPLAVTSASVRGGAYELLPPRSSVDWLDFVSILYRQQQLL